MKHLMRLALIPLMIVSMGAATNGANSGVSAGQNNATTHGIYQKGMAVFTVAKGGLMFSASIAGQKFSYSPRGAH